MIPQEFEIDFNEFDCDGVQDTSFKIVNETEDINPTYNNIKKDEDQEIVIEIVQNTAVNEMKTQGVTRNKDSNKSTKKALKSTKDMKFAEASYNDMHHFRVLENDRLQKEHEIRIKNLAEIHSLVRRNLELQNEILIKTLETYNKNK